MDYWIINTLDVLLLFFIDIGRIIKGLTIIV